MADVSASPTEQELASVARANASGKQPVVLVHGLWLLSTSWDPWVAFFEEAGYAVVAPGWPGDPDSVAAAHANPEVFAGTSIGAVEAHLQAIVERLDRLPATIGHSFGGLLAQMLAGRGLSAATVAIDPAPSRGVLPLPMAALRSASAVLAKPTNRNKAVRLTWEQFRYGFANAVSEDEGRALYERHHVAGSGTPVFQAAFANMNPGTELKVEKGRADRGPMLIISGEHDHQVPHAIARASYKRQSKNTGSVTEFHEMPGRGHSLTIDSGWQEVAQVCLDFVARFVR